MNGTVFRTRSGNSKGRDSGCATGIWGAVHHRLGQRMNQRLNFIMRSKPRTSLPGLPGQSGLPEHIIGKILRAFGLAVPCLILSVLPLAGCRRGVAGNEMVMVIEKKIPTFDPRVSSDSAAERMRQLIFNGLTRKNERFEPVPDLAESYEGSPDFKKFTFRLRRDVKFHNDRAMTALDVKYTFETMLAPGFVSDKKAEFIKAIASIEVIDPQTVVFYCHEPFPGFPNAILPIGIIPEGTTAQQATKPIGTGPFRFVSYTEDQEVQLARHKDYFDGAATIEGLRVRIVPDNSTRESELRKGSADLAINADFDPITVESLQKAAGISVELIDGTNLTHLGVNLNDPVLADRRVRQAIAYGIDRQSIIDNILRGQARPASSSLPPSQWAYAPNVRSYGYDPSAAKALLDQAGYTEKAGATRLRLTLRTSTIAISRKIGEAMQEQLKQVGIGLELQPLERQKLVQDMSEGNFQLYLNTSVGGNQSTDFFKFAYATESAPPNGQNRSRFSNQRVDQLLATSRRSTREEQRAIFAEIQEVLAEELPHIYLWYPATIVVRRERVGGLKLEPSGDWQVVRRVTLR